MVRKSGAENRHQKMESASVETMPSHPVSDATRGLSTAVAATTAAAASHSVGGGVQWRRSGIDN